MQLSRAELWHQANAILQADNDNNPPMPAPRIRNRSTRPAWNWLKKHNQRQAACLWIVARSRLPDTPFAANDNRPDAKGMSAERRKDGSPRGPAKQKSRVDYLDLAGVAPRLGDAEAEPTALCGWGEWYDIKERTEAYPANADWTYLIAEDAIAPGALFLGAAGGIGQSKPRKSRGDARLFDATEWPEPPEDVDRTIELMLAHSNLAEIGEAFGAAGRYQDKKGAALMRTAGDWAEGIVFYRLQELGDSRRAQKLAACITAPATMLQIAARHSL